MTSQTQSGRLLPPSTLTHYCRVSCFVCCCMTSRVALRGAVADRVPRLLGAWAASQAAKQENRQSWVSVGGGSSLPDCVWDTAWGGERDRERREREGERERVRERWGFWAARGRPGPFKGTRGHNHPGGHLKPKKDPGSQPPRRPGSQPPLFKDPGVLLLDPGVLLKGPRGPFKGSGGE